MTLFVTSVVMITLVIGSLLAVTFHHQYKIYRLLDHNQALIGHVSNLFELIRHKGYERGRVNVVMNFKGDRQKIQDSIGFIQQHAIDGKKLLNHLQQALPHSSLIYDAQLLDDIARHAGVIEQLRAQYWQEIEKPFGQRDLQLDDTWFVTMSEQIDRLTQLIYSLKENNPVDPQVKKYLDVLHLLAELRNHAGPVVSYLKAATFNRSSLTLSRLEQVRMYRHLVDVNLQRVRIVGATELPADILQKLAGFQQFYRDKVLGIADDFIADHIAGERVDDLEAYLKNGVQALELLQQLTGMTVSHFQQHYLKRKQTLLLGFAAMLLVSLLVVGLLAFLVAKIYRTLHLRIVRAANVIRQLSENRLDVAIPDVSRFDEVGELEKGLHLFRDNLHLLNRDKHKLFEMSQQDSLTHLLNHEAIINKLHDLHRQAMRYSTAYAVMMIDIDWFKSINDTHGHQLGDEVLKEFSAVLQHHVRSSDLLGRYGGEEFLLIMNHAHLPGVMEKARNLREEILQSEFSGKHLKLTVSVGVAAYCGESMAEDVIRAADEALYRAKQGGRNRIESASCNQA